MNANADVKKVLHARGMLFHFAMQSPDAKKVSEEPLADLFKKENIAFKPFDYKPIQYEFSKIIKQYKVDGTPVCIIKYSESDIKRYNGAKEIMDGMKTLKSALKTWNDH